jgi:hypothetical protein
VSPFSKASSAFCRYSSIMDMKPPSSGNHAE